MTANGWPPEILRVLRAAVGFSDQLNSYNDLAHREVKRWLYELVCATGKLPADVMRVIDATISRESLPPTMEQAFGIAADDSAAAGGNEAS